MCSGLFTLTNREHVVIWNSGPLFFWVDLNVKEVCPVSYQPCE